MIEICLLIIIFIIISFILKSSSKNKHVLKKVNLNQISFHKYTKFLDIDYVTFEDKHFMEKLSKIKSLINAGERDIKRIAEKTNCSYEECVFKIKYLLNKQQLTQFHIDHKANELIECTQKELKMIKKYKPFIYNNHFTIDEITTRLRRSKTQDFNELRNKVYDEIFYLVKNDLVNGMRINEVDKEIIYYSLEKNKNRDLITITCHNCGALNDVNRGEKIRCEYCKTILEDNSPKNSN